MWVALTAAVASTPPLDAVVFVEQGSSACAGAVIDDAGTVLTAYHCVAAGGRVRVGTRDGRRAIGRVRGVDRRRDLAWLDVPGLAGSPSLILGDTPPAVGDPVRAVGHPLGALEPAGFLEGTLRWAASGGEVAAVGTVAVQITAPVNPGNSGGPVLDANDAIVGVVSRRLGGDGLGFAGRTDTLAPRLQEDARGLGPLGGSVGLEAMLQANGELATPLAVGGRLEIAVRDRLVLSGSVALPLGARWEAVQLGSVAHEPFEGRVAARQRIGRGPWTVRADAWGGVGAVETVSVTQDAAGIDVDRSSTSALLVGGRLGIRGVALDYGLSVGEPRFQRVQVSLRWPGTLFVF